MWQKLFIYGFVARGGPYGDKKKVIVECWICCSPKRVYQANLNQTGNLHKKTHPHLLYKIQLNKSSN
ncbi:hypothetical protein ACLKA7_014724 [Drosophila subpalustris]